MHSVISAATILLLTALIPGVDASLSVTIGSTVGGVLGLIILILDIVAIFELVTSSGRDLFSKVIWVLIILFFPIGGLILYWCCARSGSGHQDI
ncbi:unnamed protein product [Adineta steineri]|uniref:Cardiolipin synthase N-terminal domain-containing protein n=1 Tax=Adineta steineri TaxID=433720 RepID=A0A815JFJ2_9BILA|nr:unnamed protein product [Adineta steineri]CAF1381675.1 unnamed protein product [Adineta steineri]CAF3696900.1 unnamed protein product [Adineta steineri]CAF3884477.1 unnamed protein product [Adineta steineri]